MFDQNSQFEGQGFLNESQLRAYRGGISLHNGGSLGRAIHGPMPISGETFDELPGPLVHTNFPEDKAKEGLVHMDFP